MIDGFLEAFLEEMRFSCHFRLQVSLSFCLFILVKDNMALLQQLFDRFPENLLKIEDYFIRDALYRFPIKKDPTYTTNKNL